MPLPNKLAVLLTVALAAVAPPGSPMVLAQSQPAAGTCGDDSAGPGPVIACLADELLVGLDAEAVVHGDAPLRVAVFPFDPDGIPVTAARAAELNDRLVTALVRRSRGSFVMIAREDLRDVIRDLNEIGALDDGNPVPALVESAAVDALIVGRMRRDGEDLRLRYRATRTSGRPQTIAVTDWRTLRGGARLVAQGRLLDQVARAAAKHFREQAGSLREVRLAGLSYQDTGLRTPAGDALEGRVLRELESAFASAISGRQLRVARLDMRNSVGDTPGAYVFSGTYWEHGDVVELRLRLEDDAGRRVSFRASVRRDDLPPGRLRPAGTFGPLAENLEGPIRLRLDSDRGRTPSYAIGEHFNFLLRTDVDAYLYCFYLQADETLVKIFPNSRHTDARLAGGQVHEMPGSVFPFSLDVLPPAGIELLKCYATLRDVSAELPRPVRENSLRPLPPAFRFRLSTVFRGLPDAGTTEASLPITVTVAR